MFHSQNFGAKQIVILCATLLACGACGVRGPLTVNPKPIKGLDGVVVPAPTDLRAAPASPMLYGADGKQHNTPTATPETKQP